MDSRAKWKDREKELEDRAIESTQSKQQKQTKEKLTFLGTCGTITKDLTFRSSVLKRG